MIYTDISQNAALVHTRESCKMFTLEAWKVFFSCLFFATGPGIKPDIVSVAARAPEDVVKLD